ncbi:unnamed protein product, partial [marine sediment metagenome]
KELRRRKQFTKPSVQRRTELLKAVYRMKKFGGDACNVLVLCR